jgi:hypothetical protein
MRDKKSQAALEFLTTYAWAFLVILIMVGALAYFGILNPAKILPDRCNFGTEIGCEDYSIDITTGDDNDDFRIKLKNNVGEPIVVDTYTITTEDGTAFTCVTEPSTGTNWGRAEVLSLDWLDCDLDQTGGFTEGNKAKVLIVIDYHLAKSTATYARQVSGEVYVTTV